MLFAAHFKITKSNTLDNANCYLLKCSESFVSPLVRVIACKFRYWQSCG